MKQTPARRERIILGIDPGTKVMGYGLIRVESRRLVLIEYGVFHLKKYQAHALKLKKIFERVQGIIDQHHPDEMALEAPFYGKNVQAMLKLGRAQGVAMAAGLAREIPITEYAPKKVKQSVTGNGNASKEQVARMLKSLVVFPHHIEEESLLDASDALAVGLCHYYQEGRVQQRAGSWKAFVAENPDRTKF